MGNKNKAKREMVRRDESIVKGTQKNYPAIRRHIPIDFQAEYSEGTFPVNSLPETSKDAVHIPEETTRNQRKEG